MKAATLLTAITALILTGCTAPPPRSVESEGTITYTVYGMDCPGCHGGLEKNVKKVPGVLDASANWKQQTLTIRIEQGRQPEQEAIATAVEESNFTLGGEAS